MTNPKIYRIGLIGAGAVVRGFHLPALLKHPQVKLVALADPAPAAEQLARELGVDYAREPGKVFERPDIEAVVIATPPHFTAGLTVQALKAGKHCLSEK